MKDDTPQLVLSNDIPINQMALDSRLKIGIRKQSKIQKTK